MNLSIFEHEYNLDTYLEIQPEDKPFKLWTNEHCAPIYHQAAFEQYSVRLVSSMAGQLACFVDVGAHHGYYSLLVGSLAPKCAILAFEPVPESFQRLQGNLALNNLTDAHAYQLALSDGTQRRDFFISSASDNCGFLAHPATPTKKTITIQAQPLDAFRDQIPSGPVLVKIDTEGHELEVLHGMGEIIATVEDLRLLVEFNPKLLKLAGHAPEEMFTTLDAFGFDLYLLSESEGLYYRLLPDCHWEDFVPANGLRNILCLRKRAVPDMLIFAHSAKLSGAERSLLEQVACFRASGGMCSVVLPEQGPLVALLQQTGAAVVCGEYFWWCALNSLTPAEQSRRLDVSFRWLLGVLPLLRKTAPQVVLSQTSVHPWGALTALLLGIPHVWSITEFGELAGLVYFTPFNDVLRFIHESSNFILTNSRAVQRSLFDGLRHERIETIYRSIRAPEASSGQAVPAGFRSASALHLLIVGPIVLVKGQMDAILAVRRLVEEQALDIELLLLGRVTSADYYRQLQDVVEGAGLQERIHFMDFQEDIFPFIRQADVVLMCSRMEAFGRITLEAMLCAKPVVGANCGGTPELVEDGVTGYLYEAGNEAALAEKIALLYAQPEQRAELGRNGLEQTRSRFTPAVTYQRVVSIVSGLKGEHNPASPLTLEYMLRLMTTSLEYRPPAKEPEQSPVAPPISLEHELAGVRHELTAVEHELAEIHRSKFWRLLSVYRRVWAHLSGWLQGNTKR